MVNSLFGESEAVRKNESKRKRKHGRKSVRSDGKREGLGMKEVLHMTLINIKSSVIYVGAYKL